MKHRKLCFHRGCLSGRKSFTNNQRNEAFFKEVCWSLGISAFPNANLLLDRDLGAKGAEEPPLKQLKGGRIKALMLLTFLNDSSLTQLTALAKVAECSGEEYGSEARVPGFPSQVPPLNKICDLGYLGPLYISLLLCKPGKIIVLSSQGCYRNPVH